MIFRKVLLNNITARAHQLEVGVGSALNISITPIIEFMIYACEHFKSWRNTARRWTTAISRRVTTRRENKVVILVDGSYSLPPSKLMHLWFYLHFVCHYMRGSAKLISSPMMQQCRHGW